MSSRIGTSSTNILCKLVSFSGSITAKLNQAKIYLK